VLVKTTAAGERIAVAQEAGFRNEIARDGALRTVMPFLILVPVLLLIVADLVRKMFRPIAALSKEIDQRAEQELHPSKTATFRSRCGRSPWRSIGCSPVSASRWSLSAALWRMPRTNCARR
jgi:hypothetical protein